ncbi:MAG TPA: glycosyltransferase family protein [Puia sp.]|nr:glycosyltransferase family protein [Puia sp.]
MDNSGADKRPKILYAIQGTGNGHLSRARDIVPILQKKGDLDILISGIQADVELPYPVLYRLKGLSFIFGKKGGVDLLATYRKGSLKRLYKEIQLVPVQDYDLVINDFEPVSAWACRIRHIPCIGLSHQAAVMNPKSPKPKKKDRIGKSILENYAPVSIGYGFHFQSYDTSIFTPVIRQQIRHAMPSDKNHFTVYLPAYEDDRIIKVLSEIDDVNWQVFSKHSKKEYSKKNIHVRPIDNEAFVNSMVNCSGMLCGAGFEAPAEALFLKKKLLVIPMKSQYEQQCNAAAIRELGVPVLKSLKKKHIETIREWTKTTQDIQVNYPDNTENIVDLILQRHLGQQQSTPLSLGDPIHSLKRFREKSLEKIIKQLQ